jgi:hypothetical protein
MDNKGNAVAVVLIVAAIIVVLAVSTQYSSFSDVEPLTQSNQKIQSETTLTIDEALDAGTEKFLENGFSFKSNVWYYNSSLVPDINHLDLSYNSFVNSAIGIFLNNASMSNPEYSISNYDVDVNAFIPNNEHSFDLLNEKEVDFDVNVFASSTDGSKILKSPDKASKGYSVWNMYKNLYSWFANNPNYFGTTAISALEASVPSIMSACTCVLTENTQFDLDSEKSACKAKAPFIISTIQSSLDKEMNKLNALFYSSKTTCAAKIINYEYNCDNVIQKQFCLMNATETAAYKCFSKSKKASSSSDYYTWDEKKGSDLAAKAVKNPSEVYSFPAEVNLFPSSSVADPVGQGIRTCPEGTKAKEDVIAFNPKLFVEAKVTCTDFSQIIGLFDEQKNLSSEIVLKVAIKRQIDPQGGIALTDQLDTTCGGGTGGGGDGNGGDSISEPCIAPSTLCVTTSVGCFYYDCYEDGKARPILGSDGKPLPADCCRGGVGPDEGCKPINTCFKASGVPPNCIQTPKNCASESSCNTGECNPNLPDGCVKKPIIDDANKCTTERCDNATGLIIHEPVVCSGSNLCNQYACDESTGFCKNTPLVVCNKDGNFCTKEECNISTGVCETTNRFCGTSTKCDTWTCNSNADVFDAFNEKGACEKTTLNCNDNNGCTADSCNNSTGCQNSLKTFSCPQTTATSCGTTKCVSISADVGACVIQNPVDCTSVFSGFNPKECYSWTNSCSNGFCTTEPTPKCNEYTKLYCHDTLAERQAAGCTSLDSPVSSCCYVVGQ